ncbi:hypothetical protein M2322_002931 [Rhodoblastus acidophilus]|uniref:hypothetical protein n=1 Tax=Rhodoblastus acidophilus TaxID=1074 RepID=UPI00222527F8|nr:hypothetical protein [Rhodoblastus acidophilus]MCW2317372.1 hypothetical protein [Rhodoblastus acidophilus]
MRQIALLLATTAALASSGAALAASAQGFSPAGGVQRPAAPARPHGPGPHVHGQGLAHHPGHHHHPRVNGAGIGWPVFMAPPAASGPEFVTHDFIYPGPFRPRPPHVQVLEDKPVVFREPPHIIQLGKTKHRAPIFVVRRGTMTEE